jgi:putative transposase
MKPKRIYSAQQRHDLVVAVIEHDQSVSSQSLRLGISRQTAHRWLNRYRQRGQEGLQDQSTRPHHQANQLSDEWIEKLVRLRRSHPTWGPKKLITLLLPAPSLPSPPFSVRTLGRWLQRLRISRKLCHRALPGPRVPVHGLSLASRPHDVWTIDFKGWTRTRDGRRWDPLTVRDLYSRMGLVVRLLPDQSDHSVRPVMRRLFIRHGLPRIIRVDNGVPFAAGGPLNLSHLSLWWRRLGIQVEFTRRGAPQDNGSHEQFHRVYKAEVFHRKSPHGPALQRRTDRWLWRYNHQRPHENLQQKLPVQFYRKSPRRYRPLASKPTYPLGWKTLRVTQKGYIRWKSRLRLLSKIAGGLLVGLKPLPLGHCEVYIDRILIGTLYPNDKAGMRPAKLHRQVKSVT